MVCPNYGTAVLKGLSEELPVRMKKITRILVLGPAHTRAGRVARTNFFDVLYPVRYRAPNVGGSGTSGAPPQQWDGSIEYAILSKPRAFTYRFVCCSTLCDLTVKDKSNHYRS